MDPLTSTSEMDRGDKATVLRNPRKGNVGFTKGTIVTVLAKDDTAFMVEDDDRNCFWLKPKELSKITE